VARVMDRPSEVAAKLLADLVAEGLVVIDANEFVVLPG